MHWGGKGGGVCALVSGVVDKETGDLRWYLQPGKVDICF